MTTAVEAEAASFASPGMSDSIRRMLRYARPQWPKLAAVVGLSMLDMGLNAQLSLSFKYLIDDVFVNKNSRAFAVIVAALGASIAIVATAGVFRDRLYASAIAQVAASLRTRLFEHLQKLSAGFYARTPAGEIISRFSTDVADLERVYLNAAQYGIMPVLDAALSTALAFWLDWRLALIAVLAFPLCLAGPRLLSATTARSSLDRKRHEFTLLNAVGENVAAQSLVRAFALENFFLRRFHASNLDVRSAASRLGFSMLLMERSGFTTAQALQVVVIAGGGWLVFRGEMSIGAFAAFLSIFVTLAESLSELAQYLPDVAQAGGAIESVEQLLIETAQVADAPHAASLAPLSRAIEFRDVTFSYDGSRLNLDGVSLTIPAGSSAAFVGPSGSGKSTILTLIMRLYDPASGAVLVDGVDLRAATLESLRAQTAIVFQDNFLLTASIRENIRIADPESDQERIERAARQAGLLDFIDSLPEGYDTVVSQGWLSGGQRQRLAIARALLRNPRLLILDEATSALDSATEAHINRTIEEAAEGRTVLSVTHRLGSAVKADQIFFLDKGRVVEHGTHAELLEANGAYARMWGKQSGFEISAAGDEARVTVERLRDIPLLADLDESVLVELQRSLRTERCAQDDFVFHEGEGGDKLYLLVRGTAEVLKASARGPRRVEVLQDGDIFGEQALLNDQPRSASVRAKTDCILLTLTREKFRTITGRAPELRWKLREAANIAEYRTEEAASGEVSPWSKYRHDLLTPVNHILGYGEILAEDLADAGQREASTLAQRFCEAGRTLTQTIDSRLPSGRTPAGDAIESLRIELSPYLAEIDKIVGELEHHDLEDRAARDLENVAVAAIAFRALLYDPESTAWLPGAGTSRLAEIKAGVPAAAGHILVVDDNHSGRDLLCRKLEREGYLVSSASGGAAAIEMVEASPFDLVLLDVMMPDIGGIDVLQRWKSEGRLAHLPVIVTSAMDEVASAVRCIDLGAEDYLTKPFDPAMLRARIANCIEKKRQRERRLPEEDASSRGKGVAALP